MIKEQPKIKPETIHKNQVTNHILIPVLATALICLMGFIFLLLTSSGQPQSTEEWANISIMFLILPMFLLGIIGLLVLLYLSKIAGSWNKTLPNSLSNIRNKALGLNQFLQSAIQKTAKPMVGIKAIFTGIKSIFK